MQPTVKEPYSLLRQPALPMIWSMRPEARLSRQLARLRNARAAFDNTELLLREDAIFDTPVLRGLMGARNLAVVDAESGAPLGAFVDTAHREAAQAWLEGRGEKPAILTSHTPADIAGAYHLELRKREAAACHRLTPDNAREVEWRLFMTAYKGVTDFVTKYWWPRPAFHVTRWCAAKGITPNQVTTVSGLLVLACYWLFAQGLFWPGMLLAWAMTFLDTVDGKLARVTLTSSPLGNIFDHGIDLIHPPFWYYAWALGLAAGSTPLADGWFAPLMWLLFGGYIAGRLCEGYFARRYGMHLHVWRRFDSRFRLFLARRNPNMVLLQLSLLVARPDWGLLAVVGWTVLCLGVQCVQVAQAEAVRRSGGRITSWLDAA
ncbi:MAG: CDP-alcohol phosphatidyltransferase family protein [Alphaproteobacteria bacterium]|nr:CDP-alcohol phosphatidyltransferase family protein [Alphaproteobacteria bacterium]